MRDWTAKLSWYFRYGGAVGVVAAALAITYFVGIDRVGLDPLFFAAVMISAYFGGMGPGLLATLLAGFCSAYFFLYPPGSVLIGWDDVLRTCTFVAVSLLISSLHTRTRQSEQKMMHAREEAVEANRAKDRFLAILSHELRNPLSPILALATLWEHDRQLSDDLRGDLATICRNVKLEIRLIDDLLDLNRITSGKLSMRVEDVDAIKTLNDAMQVCRSDADAKGLRLITHVTAERTWVRGDAARLQQILWNVLKNAVKFTPAGGTITVTAMDGTDGALEIGASDTGMGISPEAMPRLFAPFEQGGREITREYGGLGLGLAISRMLVEAHGGTIYASSEGRGRGSTFTIRLPAIEREHEMTPESAKARNNLANSPV